jgi:Uma2 family endonuclease
MVAPSGTTRPVAPGSSGWCVADLDDPAIARQWDAGRYEMIEGVIRDMGAAFFAHNRPTNRLLRTVERHLDDKGESYETSFEVDLILDEDTLFQADAVLMRPADVQRHYAKLANLGRSEPEVRRLVAPPTLVIESVSEGHDRHDYHVKRDRYASFGVPYYWIANRFDRSLLCLRLEQGAYLEDNAGHGQVTVHPSAFPGLAINLAEVFD